MNSFHFKKPENASAWLHANSGRKMPHTQKISCVLDNMVHSASVLRLLAGCTAKRWRRLAVKVEVDDLSVLSETRALDFCKISPHLIGEGL